jgi:uncharacterized protein
MSRVKENMANMDNTKKKIEELEKAPAREAIHEHLIDEINEENRRSPVLKIVIAVLAVVLALAFVATWFLQSADEQTITNLSLTFANVFNKNLLIFIAIGLGAQMVDGALGMAYGATSTSLLSAFGVSQAAASGAVHIAEVFTTGASGLSHLHFKNVNKRLFNNLVIPGVIGSIIGAYLLADVLNENYIKPFVSLYLIVLGVFILRKAFVVGQKKKTKRLAPLAATGGFMDAIGGGGWGPIVTSTLLSQGRAVNYTVGSVNLAEFFVALASGAVFAIFQGVESWQVIVGLIIGGVFASPFAALLVTKIKRKPMIIIVGTVIILLSINNFQKSAIKLYKEIYSTNQPAASASK